MTRRVIACLSASILLSGCGATEQRLSPLSSDAVIEAAEKAPEDGFVKENGWNEPMAPFTVIGNVHYVGTKTVSAWLITDPKGHILIDSVVPQSAPQIIANVKTLGFDPHEVKYLLNSHAHIDHAGGLAGLQRATGALMLASAADKPFLEAGDIGHGPSAGAKFPPIRVDRIVKDGDVVRVGKTALTALLMPGHSPGCTSWTMRAKGADGVDRSIFFHCSATVAGQSLNPEAYRGIVANFRASLARARTLKADIFLANHENFFDLHEKRAKQLAGDANAFVDPGELGRFTEAMAEAFEATLAKQQAPH